MCGRFEQHIPATHGWAEVLRDWPAEGVRTAEVRPTDRAATYDAQGFRYRTWWLIPPWSKSIRPNNRYPTFNARAETLAEKPSFRGAWRQSQRCIVPVSRYFEWTGPKGSKVKQAVSDQDGRILLLAGLWESCSVGDETAESFTIVTVPAHESIAWLHPRMPLALRDSAEADCWLTGSPAEAAGLLVSPTADYRSDPRGVVPLSLSFRGSNNEMP